MLSRIPKLHDGSSRLSRFILPSRIQLITLVVKLRVTLRSMDQVAVYARGLTRVRVGSDVRLLPRSAVSCSSFLLMVVPILYYLLFSCIMSPTEADLEGILGVIVSAALRTFGVVIG